MTDIALESISRNKGAPSRPRTLQFSKCPSNNDTTQGLLRLDINDRRVRLVHGADRECPDFAFAGSRPLCRAQERWVESHDDERGAGVGACDFEDVLRILHSAESVSEDGWADGISLFEDGAHGARYHIQHVEEAAVRRTDALLGGVCHSAVKADCSGGEQERPVVVTRWFGLHVRVWDYSLLAV